MSDDSNDFAPPAFRPESALQQLRRSLRELRPLAERGNSYLLQGHKILELNHDEHTINARIAKRPTASTNWDSAVCRSSADVRKLLDDIKLRLTRWTDE